MVEPTRMSPGARTACRVAGITLLVVGLGLFAMAPISVVRGMDDVQQGGSPFGGMASFVAFGFGGVVLIGVGAFLTRLGFLRLGAEILATETSAAVEHASAALGRGLRAGGVGGATQQVVRVKCRGCGFLESEDATYCSKCGKRI